MFVASSSLYILDKYLTPKSAKVFEASYPLTCRGSEFSYGIITFPSIGKSMEKFRVLIP